NSNLENRICCTKRYSLENYLYDPVLICSLFDDKSLIEKNLKFLSDYKTSNYQQYDADYITLINELKKFLDIEKKIQEFKNQNEITDQDHFNSYIHRLNGMAPEKIINNLYQYALSLNGNELSPEENQKRLDKTFDKAFRKFMNYFFKEYIENDKKEKIFLDLELDNMSNLPEFFIINKDEKIKTKIFDKNNNLIDHFLKEKENNFPKIFDIWKNEIQKTLIKLARSCTDGKS
ncbi:hypothetical protein BpHYR1_038952, partial [Brachionus plicatilis]